MSAHWLQLHLYAKIGADKHTSTKVAAPRPWCAHCMTTILQGSLLTGLTPLTMCCWLVYFLLDYPGLARRWTAAANTRGVASLHVKPSS